MKLALHLVLFLAFAQLLQASASDLLPAHSHNDYEQARPLSEAFELGFKSIEVDIHLQDGALLVGHDAKDLKPERTLEKLYLEPLSKQLKAGQKQNRLLLVDIKTDGGRTYQALKPLVEKYKSILTLTTEGAIQTNALMIVISGNRPTSTMQKEDTRVLFYDARLTDLPQYFPNTFAPLVSDNWQNHFQWRGQGEFPEAERKKLHALVQEAHAQGKMIRFWAAPDLPAAWDEQQKAGVDLINTDKLQPLADHLRSKKPGKN